MNAREFKETNDYYFGRLKQAIETFAEAYAEHRLNELFGISEQLKSENESLKKWIEELKWRNAGAISQKIISKVELEEQLSELKAENEWLKSNQLRGFEKQWSKETTTEATNETD